MNDLDGKGRKGGNMIVYLVTGIDRNHNSFNAGVFSTAEKAKAKVMEIWASERCESNVIPWEVDGERQREQWSKTDYYDQIQHWAWDVNGIVTDGPEHYLESQ